MPRPALYLGLMSGTSQDGVDAAIVQFPRGRVWLRGTATLRYPGPLREKLLRLARDEPALTLQQFCELDQAVARRFAQAASAALRAARLPSGSIAAIGSHGQTVFHQPAGLARSSVQLGDPNRIARLTGITTVADFRRADMAAGGQGAPLVPAFHHALFATRREGRAVVNIGGIANVTVLPGAQPDAVRGFDTGPGNGLLDEWIRLQRQARFDRDGRWAASGIVDEDLLGALLSDRYFAQLPPKSTGRGYFNLAWVRRRFPALRRLSPADVQCTLVELTAISIAQAVERYAPRAGRILVCGGGVRNGYLMSRLRHHLAHRPAESTAAHGLDPQWVEAAAFAWLAMRALQGKPGNLPAVTGAADAAVLGGIYQA